MEDQKPQEDISQTVERKRREFNDAQDKAGVGTLGGFLSMLKKRRDETNKVANTDLEKTGDQSAN